MAETVVYAAATFLAHSHSSDSEEGNIHQELSGASWMQVVNAAGWFRTTPPGVIWKRTCHHAQYGPSARVTTLLHRRVWAQRTWCRSFHL